MTKNTFVQGILDFFPIDLLNPTKGRLETPRIYLRWKLNQARRTYHLKFTKNQIKKTIDEAAAILLEKRNKIINKSEKKSDKPFSVRRQQLFDENNVELPIVKLRSILTTDEVNFLVETLKQNPDIPFFSVDMLPGGESRHPSIEERILYIWNSKLK